jgi:hypothetical protein
MRGCGDGFLRLPRRNRNYRSTWSGRVASEPGGQFNSMAALPWHWLWGAAGIGVVIGMVFANWLGRCASFEGYKRATSICCVMHGGSCAALSQAPRFPAAMLFIGMPRAETAVSSVLNMSQVAHPTREEFRGRVFSAIDHVSPRGQKSNPKK